MFNSRLSSKQSKSLALLNPTIGRIDRQEALRLTLASRGNVARGEPSMHDRSGRLLGRETRRLRRSGRARFQAREPRRARDEQIIVGEGAARGMRGTSLRCPPSRLRRGSRKPWARAGGPSRMQRRAGWWRPRARFQEAEQRKRLAKADPGASSLGGSGARHAAAPAERRRLGRASRRGARRAGRRRPRQPPAPVPEPTPAPSPADPAPPVKRKRGRPPKVKPLTRGAAPASAPKPKKHKPNASPAGAGGEKTKHLGVHRGRSPLFPARRGDPAADPARSCRARRRSVWSRRTGSWRVRRTPRRRAPLGRAWRASWTAPSPDGCFLTVRVDGCLLRGLVWDPDDARAT